MNCKNKEIKRDYLEDFVIREIERHLLSDDVIPILTKNLNEYVVTKSQEGNIDTQKFEVRLSKLKKEKDNIVEAICKTGYRDAFSDKLAEIEEEIKTITLELNKSPRCDSVVSISEEMVRHYMADIRQSVEEKNIPQLKRFIHQYVQRVDVYSDHIRGRNDSQKIVTSSLCKMPLKG